jgi:hypothetical protein
MRRRRNRRRGGKLTVIRRFFGAGVAMSELALRLTLINVSELASRTRIRTRQLGIAQR